MEVGHVPREQITHNRIVDRMVEAPTLGDTEPPIPEVTAHNEIARRNVHVEWNRTGGSGALGVQHDIGWV